MSKQGRIFVPSVLCGLFVFFDQFLKYLARTAPEFTYYVWKPWLGWELYQNRGIAFSLPFPNWLIVMATPIVLLFLILWLAKHREDSPWMVLGGLLILAGAISNYIDRVLFGVTIDYLRLFTSVINIADIMITVGVLFILFGTRNKN